MPPFEALYGKRCRSPIGWFEIGEAELIGPDLAHQAMKKVKIIKERLKTAQSRQKSYSDISSQRFGVQRRYLGILQGFPHEGSNVVWKERKIESEKIVGDPSLIVPVEAIEANEELSYGEIPVVILDRKVRKLRNKEIVFVKVLWRNQQVEEATWEAEEEMKKKYPYLFE
ncbi:uncharacterized protein [Nicotiana sylvestris]|uniref:uncharacterized protein n=1 Tax=Nicotiana sylvestris TaxID=4096 RepID=UPI00388CB27C